MDAIRTGTLWFGRSDTLGDPAEGSRPLGDARFFEAAWEQVRREGVTGFEQGVRKSWRKMDEMMKRTCYMSCWQMRDHDSMQMWERYCGKQLPIGIAIQTTYERLDAAVPLNLASGEQILMGLVTYGDYRCSDFRTNIPNAFGPLMTKQIQYIDESEVRLIFKTYPGSERGIRVPAHFPDLIEQVVISPYGSQAFLKAATGFCQRHGITGPVVRSPAREVLQVF